MDTYTSICDLWGNDHDMSADTGATATAVQKWRQRDKIPPGWWLSVVRAAKRRKFKHVSLERLAVIAEQKRAA